MTGYQATWKFEIMSMVRDRNARRAIAIPALLLTSLLGVVGPLVERADIPTTVVMESEHDPGSCPAPHDHRLCTQASANQAAPSERAATTAFAAAHRTPPRESASALAASSVVTTPPARAPPSR